VCKEWHAILSSPLAQEWLRGQVRLWAVTCYTITGNDRSEPTSTLAWGFTRRQVALDIIRTYKEKWQNILQWPDPSVKNR